MEKSSHFWLSVWTAPRATIARIIADKPNRKAFWFLAAVYGFCSMMNLFQTASAGLSINSISIIVLSLLIAPIWGYVVFTFWSWVVSLVGKWFSGQGTFVDIRASYAISCVPLAVTAILWLLMTLFFGRELFINFPDAVILTNVQLTLIFIILIAKVILAVWSLIIYINALAEVQKYSVLRSILTILVSALLLGVLSWLIWVIAVNFSGVAEKSPTAFMILHDGLEILRKGT